MKKTLAILLALCMVLGLCACGASAPAAPAATEAPAANAPAEEAKPEAPATVEGWPVAPKTGALDPSEITIAFSVFQDDQYYTIMTQGAQAAADKYGVKLLTSNYNLDAAKELELLNTYVNQGVNGLVWNSADGASYDVLKDVVNSGIPVSFGSPLDGVDLSPFYGMFSNNQASLGYNCGVNSAPIIKEKFGDKTIKIAILQFKTISPVYSADRVDNFLKALNEAGVKYEVVADQDAWMSDTALEATMDILTAHPDIDVFFGGNDGGTVGSTLGIKNAGKAGQTIVCGIDASLQLLEMVRSDDDILQVCAGQNPFVTGYSATEQVIKVLMGGYNSDECSQHYGQYVVMDTMDLVRGDEAGLQEYEDFMHGLGVEG